MITDNLRRLAGVNEPPIRRRLGACCRNPERFSAKDLNANSVQRINVTSGAKAQVERDLYGTAKAVPFHEPLPRIVPSHRLCRAVAESFSKSVRCDTSQLNRLGVAYFLICLLPISATSSLRLFVGAKPLSRSW